MATMMDSLPPQYPSSGADPGTLAMLGLGMGMMAGRPAQGIGSVMQAIGPEGQLARAKAQEAFINQQLLGYQLKRLQSWDQMINGGSQAGDQETPSGASPGPKSSEISSPGAFLPPGDNVGPTAPLSQAPQTLTQAPGGKWQYGLRGLPDNVSKAIAYSMAPSDYMKLLATQNAPQTDVEKLMAAIGVDRNSPIGRQMLLDSITKQNWVAPTPLRNFGYADPSGLHALPMNAPQGFMPQQNPDGSWSYAPVANGPGAVAESAKASTFGKESGTVRQGVDANGQPTYVVGIPNAPAGAPTGASPAPNAQSGAAPANPPGTFPQSIPNLAGVQLSPTIQRRIALDAARNGIKNPVANIAAPGSVAGMRAPTVVAADEPLMPPQGQQTTQAEAAPQTQPAPGVVRPDLTPTQKTLNTLGQNYYDTATKDRQAVPMLRQTLDEMLNLANDPKNTFGPGAPEVARLKALANNVGVDMTGAQTAQDVMGKLAANFVMTQLGQGGTGTDSQMNQIIHSTPGGAMTNGAIKQVIPLLAQQLDVRDARANVAEHATQGGIGGVPSAINQFNRLASPPVVQLGMQLSQASKNGNAAAFFKGLTPQQRAMLPAVRQLDALGAF